MKLPFSNASPERGATDELGPLRELRSPLSMSAIRERVLERAAAPALAPALWGQFRNILAEFLVIGVAGAALLKIAGPAVQQDLPHGTHPSYATARISEAATRIGANGIGPFDGKKGEREKISIFRSSTPVIAKDIPVALVNAVAPSAAPLIFHSSTTLNLHPSSFKIQTSSFSVRPSSFSVAASPVWFASASSGAIFSRIRILGERGEIGFQDGWKTVALSYMTADGSRDLRDELIHHPGMTAPLLSKEHDQEISLLIGATAQAGPFELRAMAGPAYLSSSSAYFSPLSGTTGAPASFQGAPSAMLGAAAEISALYAFNSSIDAGIAETANYRSGSLTDGLFASIEYRFGPQ